MEYSAGMVLTEEEIRDALRSEIDDCAIVRLKELYSLFYPNQYLQDEPPEVTEWRIVEKSVRKKRDVKRS